MSRKPTLLEQFQTADLDGQLTLLKDAQVCDAVKGWLGEAAYNELQKLIKPAHLGVGPSNIVFVPGVMGSTLQSNGLGGVWWLDMMFARDKLNGLALSANGAGDADTDADIRPAAISVEYVPFRQAIASSGTFGGSEQFPYDWRKTLRTSADALRDKIVACRRESGRRVHLVGHSMGGLMIRTALGVHGATLWPLIDKIVFIGTPHYGSPSIAGYLKKHLWGFEALAVIGMYLSREAFRTMRGVIGLLPAPIGIYPGSRQSGAAHPCANFNLYDAADWKLDLDAPATTHLQDVLNEVCQFHTDLHSWHDALLQTDKDRMLMIAGVGQETLFRLEFDTLLFGQWERAKKITERVPGDPHRDGDGRVPVASAALEGVTIRYVEGVHGGLPNIPAVASDVVAWLSGKPLKLPATPQAALAAHLSAGAVESAAPNLDHSGITQGRFRSLPNYEDPSDDFKRTIEARLKAGQMPEVNLARLL